MFILDLLSLELRHLAQRSSTSAHCASTDEMACGREPALGATKLSSVLRERTLRQHGTGRGSTTLSVWKVPLEDKAVLGAAISFKTTGSIRITLLRSSERARAERPCSCEPP